MCINPPLFEVCQVLLSPTQYHVALIGQRGATVLELPQRWGKKSEFEGGRLEINCKWVQGPHAFWKFMNISLVLAQICVFKQLFSCVLLMPPMCLIEWIINYIKYVSSKSAVLICRTNRNNSLEGCKKNKCLGRHITDDNDVYRKCCICTTYMLHVSLAVLLKLKRLCSKHIVHHFILPICHLYL